MVTGQEAFEGEGAVLASAILRDDPPLVSTIRPEAAPLDRVISRLLTKDPDHRWQTARDLIAELKWIRGVPDVPPPRRTRTRTQIATTKPARSRRWITVSLVVFALAGVGVAFILRDRFGAADAPAVRFTIPVEPVNAVSFGGALGSRLAISPDGERLVYVGENREGSQLYLRPLDSLQATAIAGTRGAISAFFSPDGNWIGFFAGGKLKKVRLSGEPVVTICDAVEAVGASWGSDDVIVFAPTPVSALFRVSSNGGTPKQLTTLVNGETSHRWPEILPGGKTVVFAAASGPDFTGSRIVAQTLGTNTRVNVTEGTYPHYTRTGHLVFARDSAIFGAPFDAKSLALASNPISLVSDLSMNSTTGAALFALSSSGTLVYRARVVTFAQRQMVWVNRSGSEEVISEDRRPYLQPRISPDGKRLAIAIGEVAADRDVWLYDLVRRTMTRLTFDVGEDETPVWSPDGTRIAISGARQGQPRTIFTVPATGSSQATQIATTKYITHLGDWRARGRRSGLDRLRPGARWGHPASVDERRPTEGARLHRRRLQRAQPGVLERWPLGRLHIDRDRPERRVRPGGRRSQRKVSNLAGRRQPADLVTRRQGVVLPRTDPHDGRAVHHYVGLLRRHTGAALPRQVRPRASGRSELRRGARRPLPDAQVPGASRPAAAPRGSELVPGTSGPRFLMKIGRVFRPAHASAQFLNGDVLVPGLRFPATMDLQAD